LAAAKLRDVLETLAQPPDGVRASRRLVVARDRTRKYSVPVEGTFEHCIKKLVPRLNNGTNGTNGADGMNGTDDTIVKTCTKWHETVGNMYKAREVFRNDVALNASFGSRDALASMVSGAISAATMNITEYITEEKSYIQNWKQNITSKRDTFILERTIANGVLVLGDIFCLGLGPVGCIGSNIGSQTVQWGIEIPTFKTSAEIDDLMRNEYNRRADSYLTEKGKQVNELAKFLLAMLAMNETQHGPLVLLGEVFTSYVALTVASNATKTVTDVHSDLDSILGDDDLDADVKMLAGMMFDDAPPPYVLDSFPLRTAVKIIFTIAALWNAIEQIILITGVFNEYARNKADLERLRNAFPMDLDPDAALITLRRELQDMQNSLNLVQKAVHDRQELMSRIIRNKLTEADINYLKVPRDLVKADDDGTYAFISSETRLMYYEMAKNGKNGLKSLGVLNLRVETRKTELNNINKKIVSVQRITELSALTKDKPSLDKMAKEPWHKNGVKAMIVFTAINAVVDGLFTLDRVNQINDFIDSAVSKRTSTLEITAGILKAWQELHKTT
jgi:hypothetical protein